MTAPTGPPAHAHHPHHVELHGGDVDPTIHGRRWWSLAVLCLSLVLIVAANASLNVALPDMQARLDAGNTDLQWIVDVYGLVFAGLLLPAGALADRFGRKTALQFGLVVFGTAAFVASFGTETWHLIAARAVMGFGGNGITYSVIAAEIVAAALAGRPDPDAELYAPPA